MIKELKEKWRILYGKSNPFIKKKIQVERANIFEER